MLLGIRFFRVSRPYRMLLDGLWKKSENFLILSLSMIPWVSRSIWLIPKNHPIAKIWIFWPKCPKSAGEVSGMVQNVVKLIFTTFLTISDTSPSILEILLKKSIFWARMNFDWTLYTTHMGSYSGAPYKV